jgi:LEA14-like dessication related protein
MDMMMRTLSLALVGLMLTGCAALQEQFKEPTIAVQDMQVRSVSLTDMQLDFILGVDNPNPIAMAVSGLSYRLELEDRPLFEGTTTERVKVAANGSSRISLPFTLSYEDVLGGLDALAKRKSLPYTLSGKVDLGLFSLPYSRSGELHLPSLPEVSISGLRVEGFELGGVSMRLGLTVSNANAFPLKLSGLSGNIKLGGVSLVEGKSIGKLAIGAKQQDEVELAVKLGYLALGGLVDTLRRADKVPLSFDGAISVPALQGERQIPFHWSGDVAVSR